MLQEEPRVISAWGGFNRSVFVSVIGDSELEQCYKKNPGAFIYGVGNLKEKVKDGKTYRDLRPRGWLLGVLDVSDVKGKNKKGKRKK